MATDRRTRIADAAIATIAREGLRGVTHRAVDRAAGLPEGSTSYYFRTREALLSAALARMAELDVADVELPEPGGRVEPAELTALLIAVLRRWLTSGRERTLARFELSLEATRRPGLRAKLAKHRAGFLTLTESMLAAAGASEPRRRGHALAAAIDGLLFHQITGADALSGTDLEAACRDMLATALR